MLVTPASATWRINVTAVRNHRPSVVGKRRVKLKAISKPSTTSLLSRRDFIETRIRRKKSLLSTLKIVRNERFLSATRPRSSENLAFEEVASPLR